jgi:limonene-1,2-epoxide hydrolase
MKPKDVLQHWIAAFNKADLFSLVELYADHAINHQVANEPVIGKEAIRQMFAEEFAAAQMVCIPENIFEDGEWAIMEWKDPKGFRGCGFFQIQNGKIVFQRGYWDKLSFLTLYDLPLPVTVTNK